MPVMTATRTLRRSPDGEPSDALARLGDKVEILEEKDPWTKVKLISAFEQPEGWVSTSAVDKTATTAGSIDKAAFARECWRQALMFGVNAHYLAAVGELRSRVTDQQGSEVGPFGLIQAEWDKYRSDDESGLDLLPQDISFWRMQCAVFALMVHRTLQDLMPLMDGKLPSALELCIAQMIGPAAAVDMSNRPGDTVDAVLKRARDGDLPSGGLSRDELIRRYAPLLTTAGAPATGQMALQQIKNQFQTALDAMRPLVLQAGAEVLDEPDAATTPTSLGSTKFDLSSIKPVRRPMAQRIINAFAAAGFGPIQQAAALANAKAESGLEPGIKSAGSERSFGLFQLNMDGGLGTGHSVEELQDPDTNISIIIKEAKKFPQFSSAESLHDAVNIFVRRVERPAHPEDEVAKRLKIAHSIAPTLLA
jgi:hypothetical protein